MTDVAKIAASLSEVDRIIMGDWLGPVLGRVVEPSESFLSQWGEWRGVRLYVVGIAIARSGGLEITVNENWPPRDVSTDGFYVGRDLEPDDLVLVRDLLQAEREPTGKP